MPTLVYHYADVFSTVCSQWMGVYFTFFGGIRQELKRVGYFIPGLLRVLVLLELGHSGLEFLDLQRDLRLNRRWICLLYED